MSSEQNGAVYGLDRLLRDLARQRPVLPVAEVNGSKQKAKERPVKDPHSLERDGALQALLNAGAVINFTPLAANETRFYSPGSTFMHCSQPGTHDGEVVSENGRFSMMFDDGRVVPFNRFVVTPRQATRIEAIIEQHNAAK